MAPLVGRRVIVDGLSSKPELNGSRGIAVGFDEDKGRYTVRLDAGPTMALRPSNLTADGSADGGGGGGSGGMSGFGGGMPGFGGGGMPAGAAAQAAQAAKARLQAMLPPGVSPAQAGVAMLLLLYVAPRVLGLPLPLVLCGGGAAAFVYQSARSGGGARGVADGLRRGVSRAAAAAEAATGQRVSEAQAAALLLAGGYMLWRFVLRPSGAGAGRGGGEGGFGDIEFAAYDKGWNDALEKRKYAPVLDPAAAEPRASSSRWGLGSLFQLAMAGTLIYQMGAPGGQPWSAANAIAGARNMNPMTLVFLLNMLSGLF